MVGEYEEYFMRPRDLCNNMPACFAAKIWGNNKFACCDLNFCDIINPLSLRGRGLGNNKSFCCGNEICENISQLCFDTL